MGEVISRKADRDTIMGDVKATLTAANARASGPDGAVWAMAQARLGGVAALWDTTSTKTQDARAVYAPLAANVAALNEQSDDLIKGQADESWNELGRPANDPVFELTYPGGSGFYADANVEDQPNLMLLLAELQEANLSPKLSAKAPARAAALRESAAKLGAAVDAARQPRATVKLYDRMLTAIARSAHVELARLKRYWKSEGISESDIHAVIPDRPRNYGVAKTPATPTPDDPTSE
jgi:hypothetical protein